MDARGVEGRAGPGEHPQVDRDRDRAARPPAGTARAYRREATRETPVAFRLARAAFLKRAAHRRKRAASGSGGS